MIDPNNAQPPRHGVIKRTIGGSFARSWPPPLPLCRRCCVLPRLLLRGLSAAAKNRCAVLASAVLLCACSRTYGASSRELGERHASCDILLSAATAAAAAVCFFVLPPPPLLLLLLSVLRLLRVLLRTAAAAASAAAFCCFLLLLLLSAAAAAAAAVCCRFSKSVSGRRQIITVLAAPWLAQLVRNKKGQPVECFLFDP